MTALQLSSASGYLSRRCYSCQKGSSLGFKYNTESILIDGYSKPSPPIELSVSKLGTDIYQMGSKFLCKKVISGIPEAAVASWKERDGHYCLLEGTIRNSSSPEAAEGLIYQAGMSSAVWEIGSEAICKVKTWAEGMDSESNTLAFVASRFPHILLPEVTYSWVDEQLERTFFI